MSGVPDGVSIRSGTLTVAQLPPEVVVVGETVGVTDGSVTLAHMADLAQDKFIVRTTASTGVPQTATATAFGRALLAKTAAVAITGDYSDGTVLASVVAALVSLGLCTDGTTP